MVATRSRWSLPVAALVAGSVCVSGGACQLIGGIDDIELAPDGGGEPDATTTKPRDAGVRRPDAHRDSAPEAHDEPTRSRDAEPPGTPCTGQAACIPSGSLVASQTYCADGSATSCGSQSGALCCPGNANGKGTSGDLCPGSMQSICLGGECTQCGSESQPCCPLSANDGRGGCAGGNACIDGTCVPCGKASLPCCAGGGGEICDNECACSGKGICVACSGGCTDGCCDALDGGVCIAKNEVCSNGTTCDFGSCDNTLSAPPCGVVGKPCCVRACRDGSFCVAGQCESCGALGQPCCVVAEGKKACAAGSVCDNRGVTCTACGGPTQPCCAGDRCDGGTCNPTDNVCDLGLGCAVGCGGDNQPCCANSTCAPGLCCDATADAGWTCRGLGAACAAVGYVCLAGGCTMCGTTGIVCCARGTCVDDGGTCSAEAGVCS